MRTILFIVDIIISRQGYYGVPVALLQEKDLALGLWGAKGQQA